MNQPSKATDKKTTPKSSLPKGFEVQGYYKTSEGDRIPLAEIADHCTIFPVWEESDRAGEGSPEPSEGDYRDQVFP